MNVEKHIKKLYFVRFMSCAAHFKKNIDHWIVQQQTALRFFLDESAAQTHSLV